MIYPTGPNSPTGLTGEDHILEIIGSHFLPHPPGLLLGRGDDCAVLPPGGNRVITCDIFAENAHFRRLYFSPYEIGYKALAVNLSDVASAGATPEAFVLSLSLTGKEDVDWLHDFCRGMAALADEYGVALAGGDIARTTELNISISAWGALCPELPLGFTRNNASPGDFIFCLGELGLARLGLTMLERAKSLPDVAQIKAAWPKACAQHLAPKPQIEASRALCETFKKEKLRHPQLKWSLMDVSDGLARDLPRLLKASGGLGADIILPQEIIPAEVQAYAAQNGLDPAQFCFQGGEDYALLGTCPEACLRALQTALGANFTILGRVTRQNLTLNGLDFRQEGFDHFS